MRKWIFVMLCVLVLAGFMLAQEAEPTADFPWADQLNQGIVLAIMSFLGLGLFGVIQLAKGALRKLVPQYDSWSKTLRHAVMYVLTGGISAGISAIVLNQMGMFSWGSLALYGLYCTGVVNGWWKGLKEISKKHG